MQWQHAEQAGIQNYRASFAGAEPRDYQLAVEAAACQAISLLAEFVTDSSRYLLFSWSESQLRITITDDCRQVDRPVVVELTLDGLAAQLEGETEAEAVRFWLRDYLTTALEYLNYSLIAGFCEGDRSRINLL